MNRANFVAFVRFYLVAFVVNLTVTKHNEQKGLKERAMSRH